MDRSTLLYAPVSSAACSGSRYGRAVWQRRIKTSKRTGMVVCRVFCKLSPAFTVPFVHPAGVADSFRYNASYMAVFQKERYCGALCHHASYLADAGERGDLYGHVDGLPVFADKGREGILSAACRVCHGAFDRTLYAMWDDEVRTTFTIEEAMEQAKRTDNMMYSAGPMLEADWGKQRANELYRQMALDCLRVRTRDVVYRIRDDLLDSALMPYSLLWQGSGGRKSQTGWNYAKFRENSPGLSRFYIEYAGLASAVLLVTGIAAGFLVKSRRRRFLIFLPPAVTQCLLHVLKDGNAVDYGGLLMVTGFWCIMVFYSIIAARNGE